MKKPESPCNGCVDRMLGCHACCEKYIVFQQQVRIYNALVTENTKREDRVKYSESRLRRMYK